MNAEDFWRVMTSAQVSTALVLMAVALVYIAVKLSERGSVRLSKR